MPTSTPSRTACAARSHAAATTERRSSVTSRARADRNEATMAGLDAALQPLLAESILFHRSEQDRHQHTARLRQAYGDRLLAPAAAGPALALAIGSLVGEADLALHLIADGGITVASGATVGTGASCRDLEDLLGEGPGTDAVASGAIVTAQTDATASWLAFSPAALDLGVHSVIAVPLGPPGAIVGAVTVYSTEHLHVAAATTSLIPVLSSAVLELLLDDQKAGTTHALGPDGTATVHQATGMITARHGCSTADALYLLRARAYTHDIPLRALADLINTGRADLD